MPNSTWMGNATLLYLPSESPTIPSSLAHFPGNSAGIQNNVNVDSRSRSSPFGGEAPLTQQIDVLIDGVKQKLKFNVKIVNCHFTPSIKTSSAILTSHVRAAWMSERANRSSQHLFSTHSQVGHLSGRLQGDRLRIRPFFRQSSCWNLQVSLHPHIVAFEPRSGRDFFSPQRGCITQRWW